MRKKVLSIMIGFSLVLIAACSKPPVPTTSDDDTSQKQLATQELSNEYTTDYYKTLIPYVSSTTRGLVYSYLPNKYDIEELELSLMRHSQSYFALDKVYFQEGQYLSRDFVRQILAKKKTSAELAKLIEEDANYVDIGLNPAEDVTIDVNGNTVNPVYLSYILEQNYVVMTEGEVSLNGISIGLALNPYQTFKNELGYDQVVQMDEAELIERGKEIAQAVVDLIRKQEGLESVDIMVGLYVLQEQSSVTPGRMVTKTHIGAQSDKIKNWTDINERFYLLPDTGVQSLDYKLNEQFSSFKDSIKEYYPHYYGVIGIADFVDDKLKKLEITVNIDFYSLSEKLSFHQLITKLVQEKFSNEYEINIVIRSTQEIYGIVNREANSEDITLKLMELD